MTHTMLRDSMQATGLSSHQFAALLGISSSQVDEWASGQRLVPDSYVELLANVIGVPVDTLLGPPKEGARSTPAVWFKFRGDELVDADRESVLLIRKLGFFVNELEEVTQRHLVGWKNLFEDIRERVDSQAPPEEQGRQAARMFRASRGLAQGARGLGEVLRDNLRLMGILLIESPICESSLEGFSFFVGRGDTKRPCVFANTHRVTWFRRNIVIMHEVAHSIFEGESSGASLDFLHDGHDQTDLQEDRAEAFAREALVPKEVLAHIASQHGIDWTCLDQDGMSRLVAETHVEQRTVLAAARNAEFLTSDDCDVYQQLDIAAILPTMTDHALSTNDYLKKVGPKADWLGRRLTTIPSRELRLPVPYVKAVVDAYSEGVISSSKASEFLMIDEADFLDRFGELATPFEEDD